MSADAPAVADPRPVLADGGVLGSRCTACRYPCAQREIPWCPRCHDDVRPACFGVAGSVWSSTVVQLPVGDRPAPFALAYLDLDDGPRVLVHLVPAQVAPVGSRARITGTDRGDLMAEWVR